METKVGNEYIINTEEFCALDYNSKKRFFLKEIRPDLHDEMAKCLKKVAEIEEINDIYPERFINNTRYNILDDHDVPEFIPVKVINKYSKDSNYCVCKDLFCEKTFVIPNSLLQDRFKPFDMWYLDEFMMSHNTNIYTLINIFAEELNPPRKVRRKLKKDTK